jgi:hypothetical protein
MIKTPPSHEQIVNALGERHDSEKVKKLLSDFGITWNDVKLLDKDTFSHRYSSVEDGFSLLFEDIGEVQEMSNHDIGDGPFLLTKVTFSGFIKDNKKYMHLPWPTLNFESTVDEVSAVLGSPFQTKIGPLEPFQWVFKKYKISMHWLEGLRKNRGVTYWYTPEA